MIDTMDEDWLVYIGVIITTIILAVLSLLAIIGVGWIIDWLFNKLTIEMNRTLYWTGIALLIPFVIFGKTKVKKDD